MDNVDQSIEAGSSIELMFTDIVDQCFIRLITNTRHSCLLTML